MPSAVNIFISYSRDDRTFLDAFEQHLSPLKRQGLVNVWVDRSSLAPGSLWQDELEKALEAADIIVLLISAAFLASPYCYDQELSRALDRQKLGDVLLLPVLIRPVSWNGEPISRLQALPEHGRPVSLWSNPDEAWVSVVQKVREAAEALRPQRNHQPIQAEHKQAIRRDFPQTHSNELPSPGGATRYSRAILMSALSRLLLSQFEHVVFLTDIPTSHLSPAMATQAIRAVQIIGWAEQQPAHYHQLVQAIESVVPGLLASASAEQ